MENYGILLADDEPVYHAIVSAALLTRGGRVDGVDSVAAALGAVRSRRYDLIVIDIDLAADDDYEVLGAIRGAAGWVREVPILAFTAHLAGGERHYVDAGFDGQLPKPFDEDVLIVALSRWIGDERITAPDDQPGDRLAALLGSEAAARMIDRFHANVADAVAEVDAGGDRRAIGHRLGGLAGTLGFAVLSAAWLGLEQGKGQAWPTVRALSVEAIARHAGLDPPE